MPLYNFKCECGLLFERLCKVGVKKAVCPTCKSKAKRDINGTFAFKEKGKKLKWGKTDYKRVMNEMIDDSKERAKITKSPYSRYTLNTEKAAENGYTQISPAEAAKRLEQGKKLATDIHELQKRKQKG